MSPREAEAPAAAETAETSANPEPPAPLLRIVRGGEPTAAELAALVAVVSARVAATETPGERSLRPTLSAWVASGLIKGTRTKA